MWSPLDYIRRKVAEAVLNGFQDGVDAATQDADTVKALPGDLRMLREAFERRNPKALEAPEPEGDNKVKARKGDKS